MKKATPSPEEAKPTALRPVKRKNLRLGAAYGKQILASLSQELSWSHFVEREVTE